MTNAVISTPAPRNEPVNDFEPGSPDRVALQRQLAEMLRTEYEIPVIIGGEEIYTGDIGESRCPHDHGKILARYHKAGPEEVEKAVRAAAELGSSGPKRTGELGRRCFSKRRICLPESTACF